MENNNFDWPNWKAREEAVLCFLVQGDQVLLIHKKTGLGQGKINGPGGRLEPGESFAEAAIRETREETCLEVSQLEEVAELSFAFLDGYGLHAKVFVARAYRGEPCETREADPFWCSLDQIPFDRMWEDDIHWLPQALQGTYVKARFVFDGDTMVSMEKELPGAQSATKGAAK